MVSCDKQNKGEKKQNEEQRNGEDRFGRSVVVFGGFVVCVVIRANCVFGIMHNVVRWRRWLRVAYLGLIIFRTFQRSQMLKRTEIGNWRCKNAMRTGAVPLNDKANA